MALLWAGGAERNSVVDGDEATLNSGTVSITTGIVGVSTYAWRTNPSSSTGFYRQHLFTSNQNKNVFFEIRIKITTLPGTTIQLLRFSNTSNASVGRIDLTSGGLLQLKGANGVQIGSNSSALSTSIVYRIGLNLDASSSPGSLEGRINGSSFASGANSSQGSWARVLWGAITPNSTCDMAFDDAIVIDTSGASMTTWPGDKLLFHAVPNAAGDANSFAVQVGGTVGSANNFTRVNELPVDDITSYNGSAVLAQEDLFNVTNPTFHPGSGLHAVLIGARMADLVGADATAAFKLEWLKSSGGTKKQSAAIIPNTTTWSTNAGAEPRNYPIIDYTDPDTGALVYDSILNMQIGYALTAANVQTIAISGVWAYVVYSPAQGLVVGARNRRNVMIRR